MKEGKKSRSWWSAFDRWEYWVGALSLIFTIALSVLIIMNPQAMRGFEGFGYLGGFLISAVGGALVIIPVPMLPVQFALGGTLRPLLGPDVLGPLMVGITCGAGETMGAATIYITGRSTLSSWGQTQSGWWQRTFNWLVNMVNRRGSLTLFLLSAIMNPFYYPISLVYGATRFGLQKYIAAAFAGKVVKCTAIAYAGYFGLRGIFMALGIPLD